MGKSIKNALELKGGVNGLKMILGATLIVLSHQVGAISELGTLFPDSEALTKAGQVVQKGIDAVQTGLNVAGNGFMGIGFVHKLIKLFKK